ncbi:Phosphatidylserine/phosphatidylglycerophosphate/cardiolipin synthase [Paracoccus aminovorans]|uniref:Phospholipase D n=1 Tax=Paracoccus aminovorans TaxID=34004 RepID=A0A1I3DL93_9RHOB|nr:phospholipase D-like domain-containing protein [Paracoccus aminovorans]CQR83886.1 phospholipase D/transphosphatidylase [Paracoccus aminovorans]SFH87532.1 Phosphatidylserine/phosphatidylglycerophosphate/cardiolipin synthase [Paracoccus aminovorans]
MQHPAFQPGRNCWRVETAERFSVIVDGADYFRALRESLLKAQRLVILIGWDFDFEIEMLPGESDAEGDAPDGLPNRIGPFLDALVDRCPGLDIYLLKWSGGALIAPGGMLPAVRIKVLSPEQIHLAFDGRHPIGACHHQKIVAIDDSLAFCGGIDVTAGRWDTRDHSPGDLCRRQADGEIAQPWHDVTTVMSGPAAAALSRLGRARWSRAQDAEMDEDFRPGADRWPGSVPVGFRDARIAIARTEPPESDRAAVAEIERLYLDSIAAARDCIYLESQYFAADSITAAIGRQLARPDGPDVVVINPRAAQGMIEDEAMHVTRSRMIRQLRALDRHDRFRILHPVNAAGEDIYVHAKVSIIDDRLLRVGSGNIDRRSMGFDTECDVALLAEDRRDRDAVRALRDGLLAEHLGRDPAEVARRIAEEGSVTAAIDALNRPQGRGLRPIRPRKESLLGSVLADTRFFDPRYRRSAQARLGITSRHVMLGGAALAAGAWLWARHRRGKSRPPE